MHNMVAWNFDYAGGNAEKKKRTLSPDYPRDPAQVYLWLEEAGWQIKWVRQAFACFMIICARSTSSATAMKHYLN